MKNTGPFAVTTAELIMRFLPTITVALLGLAAILPAKSAHALVVSGQLEQDNNGTVLTAPSDIIDVTADDSLGPAWRVTVCCGLNFEQFFFNYDQPLQATDIVLTGSSAGQWTADTNGATAGNFGQFSFALDGPVPAGLSELTFDIIAAGSFIPNMTDAFFAAKIASEQGDVAGGFVSTDTLTAVPLPAAGWMFLTAIFGLLGFSRIRRTAQ